MPYFLCRHHPRRQHTGNLYKTIMSYSRYVSLKKYMIIAIIIMTAFLLMFCKNDETVRHHDGIIQAEVLPEHQQYRNTSWSPNTMIMFRGNPYHTFYGTGTPPDIPEVYWYYRTELIVQHRPTKCTLYWQGTGWSGQMAVFNDRLYVTALDGRMYCFNAVTGEKQWDFKAGFSFKSSVTYYSNRIYGGSRDNNVYCLSTNGKLLWHYPTSADVDSSCCIFGNILYVGLEEGALVALNPATGKCLWRYAFTDKVESSPAVWSNFVAVSDSAGKLSCCNRYTGKEIWTFQTGADTDCSPVIVGDMLFTGTEGGMVFALSNRTGKVVWQWHAVSEIRSTPAYYNGRLYTGCDGAYAYCLNAVTGKELWRYKTADGVWGALAVVSNRVLFGDESGWLYCLDAIHGTLLWRINLGGPIYSTPIIVDGIIYIGSRNAQLWCIGPARTKIMYDGKNYKTIAPKKYSIPFTLQWGNEVYTNRGITYHNFINITNKTLVQ